MAGRQGEVLSLVQGVHRQTWPRSDLLRRTSEARGSTILLSDRSGPSSGFPLGSNPTLLLEEIEKFNA